MGTANSQAFWAPPASAIRLQSAARLAPSERNCERLRKGLGRFVNCGNSERDYRALGAAFPDFWPVNITAPRTNPAAISRKPRSLGEWNKVNRRYWDPSLAWTPACHKVFLFYRDTLRDLWIKGSDIPPRYWMPQFLLGLSSEAERAFDYAKQGTLLSPPLKALGEAFSALLAEFPEATCLRQLHVGMRWSCGDFFILPENDFQRAIYLLFRQSWRARVCSRCETYFTANRPNQPFCGVACSLEVSRARKREWWEKHGDEWRKRKRGRQ